MQYLINFDAQTSIEDASYAAENAKLLIHDLIIDNLETCDGKFFDYYKDTFIIYAGIVSDYICETVNMLESLRDNSKLLKEGGVNA